MQKSKKTKRVLKIFALTTASILMTGGIFSYSSSCSCSSRVPSKVDLAWLFKEVGSDQYGHDSARWCNNVGLDGKIPPEREMNDKSCYGGKSFYGESGYRVDMPSSVFYTKEKIISYLQEDLTAGFQDKYPKLDGQVDIELDCTLSDSKQPEALNKWHKVLVFAKEDAVGYSGSFTVYYYLINSEARNLATDFSETDIKFKYTIDDDQNPIKDLEVLNYSSLKSAILYKNPRIIPDAIHFQYCLDNSIADTDPNKWVDWEEQSAQPTPGSDNPVYDSTRQFGVRGSDSSISDICKKLWSTQEKTYGSKEDKMRLRITPNEYLATYHDQLPIEFTISLYRNEIKNDPGWYAKWNNTTPHEFIVTPTNESLKYAFDVEYESYQLIHYLDAYPNSWKWNINSESRVATFLIDDTNPYYATNNDLDKSSYQFSYSTVQKVKFFERYLKGVDWENIFYQKPTEDEVKRFIEWSAIQKYGESEKIYWNELEVSVSETDAQITIKTPSGPYTLMSTLHYYGFEQKIQYKLIN